MEAERLNLYVDAQSALQELETALLDVRMAEKRRKIADAQLELAREGVIGVDFEKKMNASTSIIGDDLGL